jgi:hypothetical protein
MSSSYDELFYGTGDQYYKYFPNNLRLYVGNDRFVVHFTSLGKRSIFIDRSDRKWDGGRKHEGKRFWDNPWHMICSLRKHYGLVPSESALQSIFVGEGKYRDASLYMLFKTLSTEELKTIGKNYPERPERIEQLGVGLQLYVQDPGMEPLHGVRFNGDGFTHATFEKWMTAHALVGYYRSVAASTVHHPLRSIFVAEGRDKDISLADLLLTRSDAQLKVAGHPPIWTPPAPFSGLPSNLQLSAQKNGKAIDLRHKLEEGTILFREPHKEFCYFTAEHQVRKLDPTYRGDGLDHIFVLFGQYKGKSLADLKDLSVEEQRSANLVIMPPAVVATATAAAPTPKPILSSDPLAKLAAKEAMLQKETRELDQLQEQIQRLRAYPADLEAQIAAAKAELAFLATVEQRIQELRLLEATLVEKRKILEAVELNA